MLCTICTAWSVQSDCWILFISQTISSFHNESKLKFAELLSLCIYEDWINVSGIENWRVILWAMFIVPCWIVINLIQCFKSNLLKSPQNTISRNCNWTFNDFSKLHIRTNTHKLEQMCQFLRFVYISRVDTEICIPIYRKWLMTCADSLYRWYKRGLCWGFNSDTIVCRSHFTYNGWDGSRLVAHDQAPILWKIIDNIEDPSINSIRRK